MPTITAHGLSADLPRGWDGQIYIREVPPSLADDPALSPASSQPWPMLHAANVALPAERGDYGSIVAETMGTGGIFVALLESDPADAATPLYAHPRPWPLAADELRTDQLQRGVPGAAGCQRFFTEAGRAFCLYVVVGSYNARAVLVREVNRLLASVRIDAR